MTLPFKAGWTALLLISAVGLGCSRLAQAQRPEIAPTPPSAIAQQASPATSPAASGESVSAQLAQAPLGRPDRAIARGDLTSVKIFSLDSQCERFEGETVTLERSQALEEAVGLAIAASNGPDFAIAGYRISDGAWARQVVIDLRIAPSSERLLSSLSICEGLSLFGAVRRTLVDNGQFQIDQVQFTAAGEPIFL